ncbi:MAG: tyrosine-type recombinase/integrase [Oscillospiraceae bacterium]|nr:tyrosine-type recombinase/integrase [Oscillospiraceae bacterium]
MACSSGNYSCPRYYAATFSGLLNIFKLFNGMTGAKTSKQKAKTVLNMIFESAIDDELIQKNPLKSKRLRITGAESTTTEVYSVRQMQYLIRHISDVKKKDDQIYLALQALHPLRLEEVLGLKWADVNLENMTIHIRRAVTHPTRNRPEVKVPKTEASIRIIGLSGIAASYLISGNPDDYILGGVEPYSYQRVRRMCERIQRDTGFEEEVTPSRFRTTVLTDIYDQTKDVTIAQAAAGHTTAAMTLKHYVKCRENVGRMADVIDSVYTQ